MPLIKCACGCGKELERFDKYGRIRAFIHGHNSVIDPSLKFLKTIKRDLGNSGCWIWSGAKTKNGYGNFRHRRKLYYAHRFSFEFFFGRKVQRSEEVCHSCDNPSCVNPKHLFVGNHADNMRDAYKKKRIRRDNLGRFYKGVHNADFR